MDVPSAPNNTSHYRREVRGIDKIPIILDKARQICLLFPSDSSRIVGELLPSVHAPGVMSGLAKPACSPLLLAWY
jgi:hypothetical protein